MPGEVTFRPATREDVEDYWLRKVPGNLRAVVAEQDGKVVGMGGVYYDGAMRIAFSEYKPELRDNRRAKVRGVRMIMEILNSIKGPVYAVACPDEPTAESLLQRLGFRPAAPGSSTLVRAPS